MKRNGNQKFCSAPCGNRDKKIKKRYGINSDTVHAMYKKQKGRCGICNVKGDVFEVGYTEKPIPLGIDHSHKSGKVRGLLCNHCNFGLGHLRDNKKYLAKAIKYLEEHKG